MKTDSLYDVVIIGGGPAGLSAATWLGRCRRRVLLCDAGHPRNEPSHAMHGFLSRDGIPPGEFLQICREQLAQYPSVELRQMRVADVERTAEGFRVFMDDQSQARGRILLLATGLIDDLPKIPGFRQFYGVTAHNCPLCDGWEHRDQPIAVVGSTCDASDLAIEMLLWTKDVVLCTDGPPEWDTERTLQLHEKGLRVVEAKISRLEGTGTQLERICFGDGTFSERRALFFSPGQVQHSPFAAKLGCDFTQEGACIFSAADASTNIPGLYVAGNASHGIQLAIAAAAEGAQAACAINSALLDADEAAGKALTPT